MLTLNRQLTQNSPKATLFARSTGAGSAVAVYRTVNYIANYTVNRTDVNMVSQLLQDWHVNWQVELVGLPTSTENRGGIPGSADYPAMLDHLADTRLHVRRKDREEAQGDC